VAKNQEVMYNRYVIEKRLAYDLKKKIHFRSI